MECVFENQITEKKPGQTLGKMKKMLFVQKLEFNPFFGLGYGYQRNPLLL